MDETAVTFQLTAASSAGDVTDMKVWTDSNPTSEWQPFDTLAWLPWQPQDQVHALFRDEAGNISEESSDTISAPYTPLPAQPTFFSFLPIVCKSP